MSDIAIFNVTLENMSQIFGPILFYTANYKFILKKITGQTHERSFHSRVSGYFIRALLTNKV